MTDFASVPFESYDISVPQALDAVQAGPLLARQQVILVKPNMVNCSPFPVTSHPECCRAVLAYVRRHAPSARLILADGCGDPSFSTMELFDRLGFRRVAEESGAELMDLNEEPAFSQDMPGLSFFRKIHLPKIVTESFIFSVPVLKAHSLAGYTGTLKNMMGVLPPLYYAQRHGFWRKAALHADLQRAIRELCTVVRPGLMLLDASVGLCDHHLGGRTCDPPLGILAAGSDPLEVDRFGAGLLGLDWRAIGHLQ